MAFTAPSQYAFSAAEIETFKTLGDIAAFCSISGPPLEAFFQATGAEHESMPRALGIIPAEEISDLIKGLKIPLPDGGEGRGINFIERGKLLLVANACRRCAHFAGAPLGPPEPGVPSDGTAVVPVSAPLPSLAIRKVKLSAVLRQGDDMEVPLCSADVRTAGYARLEVIFGLHYRPPPNADVTLEQLTGVKFVVDSGDIPYLDFAVWGPHGHRIARKLRMTGQVLDNDGTFRTVEIAGPPNLEVWLDSFEVMATAFLMLDVVDLGTLNSYRRAISDFHARYGPACWLLLYQAETRFRQEQLDRCKLLASNRHQAAITAGGTTEFEPTRPWNLAFRIGTNDDKWWSKEFVEPAMLFLTRTNSLHAFIGGDAPITGDERVVTDTLPSNATRPPKRSAASLQAPPPPAPHPQGTKTNRRKNKNASMNSKVNGRFKTNKAGTPLCENFQTGACGLAVNSRCPVDRTKAHQCDLCLGNNHGSNICTAGSNQSSSSGKGKGKHKGKGQKRNQW